MALYAENEQRSGRSEGDSDFSDLDEGQCLLDNAGNRQCNDNESSNDFYVRAKQSNFVMLKSNGVFLSGLQTKYISNLKTTHTHTHLTSSAEVRNCGTQRNHVDRWSSAAILQKHMKNRPRSIKYVQGHKVCFSAGDPALTERVYRWTERHVTEVVGLDASVLQQLDSLVSENSSQHRVILQDIIIWWEINTSEHDFSF